MVDLTAPEDRYRVRLEGTWATGGIRSGRGIRLGDRSSHRYMVMLGHGCAVELFLGENGLSVQRVVLMEADEATITAIVTAASGSPAWLPTKSDYLIFRGDRQDACLLGQRYLPLDGMAEERSWPDDQSVPLDSLAVAIGQAMSRANGRLTGLCREMPSARVQRVLIRVEVEQTGLSDGRMLIRLPRSGESTQGSQFVEIMVEGAPSAEVDGLELEDEGGFSAK